jgi:hypothetical protein
MAEDCLKSQHSALRHEGLILRLFVFSGHVPDAGVVATRFAMVAFHLGNPVMDVFIEYVSVPPSIAQTEFPFLAQPSLRDFVQSTLPIASTIYASDVGAMQMHMSRDWASSCLESPSVPIGNGHWTAQPLAYRCPCVSDPDALVGQVVVTGPSGPVVTLNPKPERRKKASPPGDGPIDQSIADLLESLDGMAANPSQGGAGRGPKGAGRGRGRGRGIPAANVEAPADLAIPIGVAGIDAELDPDVLDEYFRAEGIGDEEDADIDAESLKEIEVALALALALDAEEQQEQAVLPAPAPAPEPAAPQPPDASASRALTQMPHLDAALYVRGLDTISTCPWPPHQISLNQELPLVLVYYY